jgi:hypothetical protein
MTPQSDSEFDAFVQKTKAENKAHERSDLMNTSVSALIGAALAYWAYGTVAHAVLFGYVIFGLSAVANRVVWELRRQQISDESRKFIDRA